MPFEQTVTVTELAFGGGQCNHALSGAIQGGHAHQRIAQLDAISTDVLYRRRASSARNQRQVFYAPVARPGSIENRFMPVLTRTQNQYGIITVHFFPVSAPNLHVQDDTIKVAGKHQITATTQNQGFQPSVLGPDQRSGKLVDAGNPYQVASPGRNRERIQLTQIGLVCNLQRPIQANRPRISSSKPSLAS